MFHFQWFGRPFWQERLVRYHFLGFCCALRALQCINLSISLSWVIIGLFDWQFVLWFDQSLCFVLTLLNVIMCICCDKRERSSTSLLTEVGFTLSNRFTIITTGHFLLLQVSRLFQHQSIGAPVYFVVVKLVLLEKDPVRCCFSALNS